MIGDEFNFGTDCAPQKLDAAKTGDVPPCDSREDLGTEQCLVFIRFRGGRPSMPGSTDHLDLSARTGEVLLSAVGRA
jgi:hypothetical protein